MTSLLCIYGHKIPAVVTSESQNLSVQLTLRPTSSIGVLFALVHQDRVPLSVALADYHPGTDEWRDVSSYSHSAHVCGLIFVTDATVFCAFSTSW